VSKEATYYNEAEKLYLAGATIANIAELLPVTEKTLYQWSKKGDWSGRRRERLATRQDVSTRLRAFVEEKIAGITKLTPGDADEIAKIYSSIDRVEKGAVSMLTMSVEVMAEWAKFQRWKGRSPEEMKDKAKEVQEFFEYLETH
jgi:hypothetical protein